MKNQNAVQMNSPGRRAAAYWFIDGLPEILFGLFFFIPGMLVLVITQLHLDIPRWMEAGGILVGLLGWSLWLIHRPVLNFVKARITYPRQATRIRQSIFRSEVGIILSLGS